MNDSVSTPANSNKKRDLSSPDDLVLLKKNRTDQFYSESEILSNLTMETTSPSKPVAPTQLTLDDAAIKAIANALKDSIQTEISVIIKSTVETAVKGAIEGMQSQISSLQAQNDALRSENKDLKHRVDTLEFRSDAAEQYSRRDNVRISGLIEKDGENTDNEVLSMAKAVGLSMTYNDIAVSHRVGKKRTNGKPRDLLVKFVSRRTRESFYKKRVMLKSSGYQGIYVNEDLTKFRSELLYKARQMVNSKKIIGAWSSDGIIHIKAVKDNKTTIHRVFCQHDIEQFMSFSAE